MRVKKITLPSSNCDGKNERLPDFDAVLAKHGPVPVFEIPRELAPWMDDVAKKVDEEAERRAPEIAAEVAEELAAQLPEDYEFEADAWPEGDYTLFRDRQPKTQPIQALAERLTEPSPVPRNEQKELPGAAPAEYTVLGEDE